MIKLTDILNEIRPISDAKYAYYMLQYDDGDKTYMARGYLKIADYIDDNEINSYKLYGRAFNSKTRSSEWEFIEEK
jgi:hypothetical protein